MTTGLRLTNSGLQSWLVFHRGWRLPHYASFPLLEDRVVASTAMARFDQVSPIFPVRDLDASVAHYARLGFTTRKYEGGNYGFAVADDVEIHLGVVENFDEHGRAAAYLFVDDADAVAAGWVAAGVEVHPPQDTEWGQREGAVVDPDGNVIRFGSPLEPSPG